MSIGKKMIVSLLFFCSILPVIKKVKTRNDIIMKTSGVASGHAGHAEHDQKFS